MRMLVSEELIRVLIIETAVRADLIYIQDCLYLYVVSTTYSNRYGMT